VNDRWIADRMRRMEVSGIRRAFELAKKLPDPINLSIGLPDFTVAEPVKEAAPPSPPAGCGPAISSPATPC